MGLLSRRVRAAAGREEAAVYAQYMPCLVHLILVHALPSACRAQCMPCLQQAHVRQIARKIKKATMERELDLRASLANTRRLEEEDELFDHYARVCMDEWESRGKSLRPMMVELGKFDPNKVT